MISSVRIIQSICGLHHSQLSHSSQDSILACVEIMKEIAIMLHMEEIFKEVPST